jgi:hyperosmotically inducible protein
MIREANIMNNKRLWSTVGVSVLIGTLSFATGAFAHSSESLVSLGSETPRADKLQFVPSVLAEADTAPSPKDRTNDVALTAKIKDALLADKATAGAADAIHVQTTNGIVTLTGDVASQATAEHAQAVAARLLGVRDVVNDLKYPHLPGSVSAPIVAPPTNASR